MTQTTELEIERRRGAIAAAALVFAISAPVTYAAERLYEYARGEASNPILILRTLHTVYYWRVAVAVWWGLMMALFAFLHFMRDERDPADEKRARMLAIAALILIPLFALLAFVFP